MTEEGKSSNETTPVLPFYERPQVQMVDLPISAGIPFGFERITNPKIGISGVYGAWGKSYDNATLPELVEQSTGTPLGESERMDLAPLGFMHRHHLPGFSDQDHIEIETEVGSRLLQEAANASGWDPEEVDAVLIGTSGPVSENFTEEIASRAGIREDALKVSVHKACDSSTGALHLTLNPDLSYNKRSRFNLAQILKGKKVLVGGIEGLSRAVQKSFDKDALQLFGNGAGIIGLIPGRSMEFLVGDTQEVYDEQGVLAVHMYYPHSRQIHGQSMVEVSEINPHSLRFAGLMNEPTNGLPVKMAGSMGMVKLFVRNGVTIVHKVYDSYRDKMEQLGTIGKSIEVAIVHHANLKINTLKQKNLIKEGINLPMPWVIKEFGNVSAASNMIAFLRELPKMKPGDHIMFDGFGAGTYYDVLVVSLGEGVE
ncbi:MAG: 3-oxoacyl-[acyl-carrier-protein] synthase III C-terminal domain-containing protein [Anaerolineales bacterium]